MPTKVGKLQKAVEYLRGKVPVQGMFSTLDEAIQQAPLERAPAEEWAGYLQPGRAVTREGIQFPLKKAEMEETGLAKRLEEMAGQPITKTELEDLLFETRPELGQTLGKIQKRGELQEVGFAPDAPTGSRTKLTAPKYTEESLYHQSEGSGLEEDITRMSDLGFSSHFGDDAVSWSRATTHNFPETGGVRLVEEIQSDIHSKAAERGLADPETGRIYRSEQEAMGDLGEEGMARLQEYRTGYRTEEVVDELFSNEQRIQQIEGEIRTLGKEEDRLARVDVEDVSRDVIPELDEVQEQLDALIDERDQLQRKNKRMGRLPPKAPFSDPKEYARVELSKQLLNAAEEGQNYVALTRGDDQISRYSGGMDAGREKGMRYFYDQIYPSVMKRLANRYGARMTEVEMPVGQATDVRLGVMADHDMESIDDAMDQFGEMVGSQDVDDLEVGVEGAEEFIWELEKKLADRPDPTGEIRRQIDSAKEQMKKLKGSAQQAYDAYHNADEDEIEEVLEGIIGYDSRFHNTWENYWTNIDSLYNEWSSVGYELGGMKSFPAIEITPEVRENILKAGVPLYSAAGAGMLTGEDEELNQAWEDLDVGMAKGGKIIRATERFGKRAGRYKNPDIEVPEGYVSFETEPAPSGRHWRIMGITEDGQRKLISTVGGLEEGETGQQTAEALASAYNAEGYTDKSIQRVPLHEVFSDVESPPAKKASDLTDEEFNQWLEAFNRKKEARRRRLEEDEEGFQEGGEVDTGLSRLGELVSKPWEWLYEKTPAYEFMAHAPNVLTAGYIPEGDPGAAYERDVKLSKLLASGLSSQVMGADPETGEPKLGARPGLIDETLAIPTLMEIGGGTPPEWATEAAERQEALREKIGEEVDVEPAEGLMEHGFESLGIMGGQLPVPGQMFKSIASKLKEAGGLGQALRWGTAPFRAGVEWLSPVVEPKLLNYLIGAGFGGTMGALGDEGPAAEAGYKNLEELLGDVERGNEEAEAILMKMLREYKAQQESG